MKMYYKWLLILMVCYCYSAASIAQNLAITDFVVTADVDNVLRYHVEVNTTESANVYIKYNYSENGVDYEQVSQISTNSMEHNIQLIGFRAATGYDFQAFAFNNNEQVSSELESVITGVLPFNVQSNAGDVLLNDIDRQEYFIYHRLVSGSDRHFKIIDSEGEIVWYDFYSVIVQNCNGWRWTKNNTIIYGDCHVLHERDLYGNDLAIIPYASQSTNFHHDMMVLEDGNYATIYVQARDLDLSSVGGTFDQRVAGDGILVFDIDGNIIFEWNVFDYYFPESAAQQGAYWNGVYGPNTLDWTHINAIDEDTDGNFLLSVSHWDKIIKINRTTGDVMWEFGQDAQIQTPTPFEYQHSITATATSRYMLFDNLGLSGRSRVLEFAVDPVNFNATQIWSYEPDEPLLAFVMGNAKRLENGNTLVNFGIGAAIQEVNEDGELVWDFRVGSSNYRAYKVPFLNEPHAQVYVSLPDTVCLNDEPFLISTNLEQAYLTGNGIENGYFNPANAGAGEHVIAAFYGTSLDQENIVVLDAPAPTIQIEDLTLSIEEDASDYQWYINGDLIEGASNTSLTVSESGLYYVTMLNELGCLGYSDTSNFIISNIEEELQLETSIIQMNNFIEIENYTSENMQLNLFDLSGRSLLTKTVNKGITRIETNELPKGINIVQLQSKTLSISKKLIIQ